MDILKTIVDWFVANWGAVESLARNFAADLAALWALGMALAQVLKRFKPESGERLQSNLLGK